jgi:hypothetical protein
MLSSSIMTWLPRPLVIAAALALASCYSYTSVNPGQLPQLNGSFVTPVGGNVVAVRVATIEKSDGSLTQVKGTFDLKITLKNGAEMSFDHPVKAEIEGDTLVLAGGNRRATPIPLDEIELAEVVQPNGAVWAIGGGLGGAVLGLLIVFVIV